MKTIYKELAKRSHEHLLNDVSDLYSLNCDSANACAISCMMDAHSAIKFALMYALSCKNESFSESDSLKRLLDFFITCDKFEVPKKSLTWVYEIDGWDTSYVSAEDGMPYTEPASYDTLYAIYHKINNLICFIIDRCS